MHQMGFIRSLLSGWVLLYFIEQLPAQTTLKLTPQQSYVILDNYFVYYKDSTNELSFQDILKTQYQTRLRQRDSYNFGYQTATIWLKVTLQNPTAATIERVLEFQFPLLDSIDIYQAVGNRWQSTQLGDCRPFANRSFDHRLPNLRISIAPYTISTFYFKIYSNSSLQATLYLRTIPDTISAYNRESLGYGVFFSFLIFAFLGGLGAFFVSRKLYYCWYAGFALFCVGIQAMISGYLQQYILGDHYKLNFYLLAFSNVGFIISSSLFLRDFLGLRRKIKWYYRFLNSCIIGACGCLGLILLYPDLGMSILNYFVMGIILFNLMGTYWSFWLKIPSAKYIVIAWTFFLIGALVHAFRLAGLLPAQFWTMHALEFGSLLEIIAWGGALAHRYRCLYKQQEDKKQRLIQELIQSQALKERLNQALETKVVERTQELNQLNGNLLLKNQQLNDQQAILQKQKLKSDALNQLKDRLFSIISHDLRSPLNSLKSVLELIEQEDVSEVEFKELLPQINRNTHATVELLDNLLLWAKSQMHQVCVDKKSIDLSIITRKNIEFLALQAQAKQITIEARVQPGTLVFADEDMIALVVRNLISNAIKFTPQGGMITVETEQMIAFRRIAIKDTGVGMTAESLAQLFKAHNFSTRGTNNEKGTGLGLLLCQEFVEKNGGKIWAESIKGQGSTFYFLLLLPKQEFDLSNA